MPSTSRLQLRHLCAGGARAAVTRTPLTSTSHDPSAATYAFAAIFAAATALAAASALASPLAAGAAEPASKSVDPAYGGQLL